MPLMPTFTPFQVLPAAQLNEMAREIERVSEATLGSVDNLSRPLVTVRRTSAQSIANNTDTIITWQTSDDDPEGMWDPGDPTRLTVITAGLWLAIAQIRWNNNSATGVRNSLMLKNGTNPVTNPFANASQPGSTTGAGPTLSYVKTIRCAAGDPLYLNVYQTSGAAMDVLTNYGGTTFGMVWLGP